MSTVYETLISPRANIIKMAALFVAACTSKNNPFFSQMVCMSCLCVDVFALGAKTRDKEVGNGLLVGLGLLFVILAVIMGIITDKPSFLVVPYLTALFCILLYALFTFISHAIKEYDE